MDETDIEKIGRDTSELKSRLYNVEEEVKKYNSAVPVIQKIIKSDSAIKTKELHLYDSSDSPVITLPDASVGDKVEFIQVAGGGSSATLSAGKGVEINGSASQTIGGANYTYTSLVKVSKILWVVIS